MPAVKLPMNLSAQECDDIWSALVVFRRHLSRKNPETKEAVQKLIKRMRTHRGKIFTRTNQLEKEKARRKRPDKIRRPRPLAEPF